MSVNNSCRMFLPRPAGVNIGDKKKERTGSLRVPTHPPTETPESSKKELTVLNFTRN